MIVYNEEHLPAFIPNFTDSLTFYALWIGLEHTRQANYRTSILPSALTGIDNSTCVLIWLRAGLELTIMRYLNEDRCKWESGIFLLSKAGGANRNYNKRVSIFSPDFNTKYDYSCYYHSIQ